MTKIKCLAPFTRLELTKSGVLPCCASWIKMGPLGSVLENDLLEIWNNERFQYLREKMYNNEYLETCSDKNCPIILSGEMIDLDSIDRNAYYVTDQLVDDIKNKRAILSVPPARITLSDSGACNLKCIMCGSGRNYQNEDTRVAKRTMEEVKKILPNLKEIRLTGDGDPFFRQDTREFLETFEPAKYPDLEFIILTNGQMLNHRMWDKIKHNNIKEIWVSVDAATKETYEKIRVGGNWERLLTNLEMISNLRAQGIIKFFEINMTVMRSNYKEVIDFVRLAKKLKCDQVALQRFYGHSPALENIFDPPDPEVLRSLREMLKSPALKEIPVFSGIPDVKYYSGSKFAKIRYEGFQLLHLLREQFNRYIGWRISSNKR